MSNEYKKKQKQFSFAYKDGYQALEWLLEQAEEECHGNASAYVVKVLLEDKKRKQLKEE